MDSASLRSTILRRLISSKEELRTLRKKACRKAALRWIIILAGDDPYPRILAAYADKTGKSALAREAFISVWLFSLKLSHQFELLI
jgi:hypothetical protein